MVISANNLIVANITVLCLVFASGIINPMRLDSSMNDWVDSTKYFGVHLVSGRKIAFDVVPSRRSLYTAFNNICSRAKFLEEPVQLALHECYTVCRY